MKVYQVVGRAAIRQEMDEQEQAEIMARGDQQSDDRWWLGDKANKWAKNIREYSLPCSIMDCYCEIAFLYGDNVSGRTIRYYGELAAFYPEWARKEYDMLPWSHYELAMRYARDDWQDVLETAVRYMDAHNGRRPSKKWLEADLTGYLDERIQNEFKENLPDLVEAELQTAPDALLYDFVLGESEGESDFGAHTIKAAARFTDLLLDKLERVPVSDDLRGRLGIALGGLRDVLKDILQEVV